MMIIMNIKATIGGTEHEFKVCSARHLHVAGSHQATHWMNQYGYIYEPTTSAPNKPDEVMWLHLIRKQHTYGSIVFEETGEVRPPQLGEWFWSGAYPFAATPVLVGGNTEHPILRPVVIED